MIVNSAKDGFSSKENTFITTFIGEFVAESNRWGVQQTGVESLVSNFLHRLYVDEKQITTLKDNILKLFKELVQGKKKPTIFS